MKLKYYPPHKLRMRRNADNGNGQRDRYKGDYLNDERHGVGELETADGEAYQGEFRHNIR